MWRCLFVAVELDNRKDCRQSSTATFDCEVIVKIEWVYKGM